MADIPPPPEGFTLDSGNIPPPPEGFALDKPAVENASYPERIMRRAGEAWDSRPQPQQQPVGAATGGDYVRQMMMKNPDPMGDTAKAINALGGVMSSPVGAAGEVLERKMANEAGISPEKAEKLARDTGDVSSAISFAPGIKAGPAALEGAAGKAVSFQLGGFS